MSPTYTFLHACTCIFPFKFESYVYISQWIFLTYQILNMISYKQLQGMQYNYTHVQKYTCKKYECLYICILVDIQGHNITNMILIQSFFKKSSLNFLSKKVFQFAYKPFSILSFTYRIMATCSFQSFILSSISFQLALAIFSLSAFFFKSFGKL